MSLHDEHRQRLDKRVREYGLDLLEDHEQLEYILYTVFPRGDTNELAHRLLDRFVTISGVLNAEVNELLSIDGIGPRAASFLTSLPAILGIVDRSRRVSVPPKLDTIEKTIDYVKTFFYGKLCEEVYMFCLNSAYRIICVSKISDGIAGEVYIHPSKAVKQALRVNASVVVIAHNHPGGKVNPSVGDVEVNHNLDRAFSAVEIVLADSIIVTENEHFSFREMGYMNVLCDGYYKKLGIPPMGMNNNGF